MQPFTLAKREWTKGIVVECHDFFDIEADGTSYRRNTSASNATPAPASVSDGDAVQSSSSPWRQSLSSPCRQCSPRICSARDTCTTVADANQAVLAKSRPEKVWQAWSRKACSSSLRIQIHMQSGWEVKIVSFLVVTFCCAATPKNSHILYVWYFQFVLLFMITRVLTNCI